MTDTTEVAVLTDVTGDYMSVCTA